MVDLDPEQSFDRVNHDILLSRVARKVTDQRVLGLIRRYLQAGMFAGGITTVRPQGTPQGGPPSPLLSNVLLDERDRELEQRGHAFCRYADDVQIYVHTKPSGEREQRAWQSATNGRGPWWHAGASHMNQRFPKSYFGQFGLVSLLDQYHRLTVTS